MPPESLADIAADEAAKNAKPSADPPASPPDNATPSPETPSKEFIEQFQKETGVDLSKYADDAAAKKGLSEALKLVGKRNEDAENWKQFNEAIRGKEAQIAALLKGETPPAKPELPEPSSKNGDDWTPKSFDELRFMAAKIFDENGAIRSGVDQKLVDRYAHANQKLQETAFELAFAPDKVRERLLGSMKSELLGEAAKVSEEKLAEMREAAEMQSITDKHADKLFVGNDPQQLTPFAEQVNEEWKELLDAGAMPTPKLYRKAIKSVLDRQPKPNPTKPTNPNAVHKPALAPAPDAGDDIEDRFRKGLTLVDLLNEIKSK